MNYEIRATTKSNTNHVAVDGAVICGTSASTVGRGSKSSEHAEQIVDCGTCRRKMGWHTIAGSLRERTSRGLDCTAWGANKGR